ncbi:MATE family efflux transporter [Murimonas intestini]|uniref:Probable multidrug resistance protein NorM n=1 Tax=Murimonas intestini TaxID=1337051 RepID=A0AB73T3X4_9FIRM|nr:MATE family efflux transporter [Murimonas intestini]MCR1841069.1 MATE family efflux transporter [Murimonas intestini]MCR1865813.1 MATE family efflux transporter [Murimonas intestini]MCR1883233.1 MATE family efflux transporter [Murimonas intestini]
MIKDMTEGKPSRILWAFSIPMLISVMFQQIYNIADSMIAGKFVGEGALAAVGASYPITMIFMAIAMGCNIGCSVVISQLFGARKYGEMKTAITTTFFSCGALSILLTLLGLLFCHPMLEMIRTPDNIFSDAALYLNIYIGGLAFLFLYNICTGIFTALGDSRTPLYFLIGSSIGNIILDLVFVIFLKMGVAGVAWATFIAQGISCILSAVTLTSRVRSVRTQEKPALFSLAMLGKISWIAVPSILQQSFISVGNIFIQFLVNGFGSAAIAGYSAAVKLNTFSITSITTLANGLSSFTAQNIGAGKLERVRKGFRSSIVMLACVVLPFFIVYFFFDEHMLMLFMNKESDVAIGIGREFLRIVSPFYIIVGFKLMADGVLRGAGSMKCFMIATFTDLLLRVILAFAFSGSFGTTGIWMAWPVGWSLAAVLSVAFYMKGVWKEGMRA